MPGGQIAHPFTNRRNDLQNNSTKCMPFYDDVNPIAFTTVTNLCKPFFGRYKAQNDPETLVGGPLNPSLPKAVKVG